MGGGESEKMRRRRSDEVVFRSNLFPDLYKGGGAAEEAHVSIAPGISNPLRPNCILSGINEAAQKTRREEGEVYSWDRCAAPVVSA